MKTTPHPSVQPDFCLISKPVRIALGLSVAVLLALPLGLEAQSNCVPAASGLVGWWRGEGNGSDQAGTNNGTLAGNTTFGPVRVGQAFVFDGIGDAVVVGSAPNLQFQDLTIETWVKRTSTSAVSLAGNGNAVLFGYGQGGYGLYLSPAGQPALSKIGVDSVISSQSITDINFHHLAVTKSGSTIVFYIDGVAYPAPAYNPGFVFSTVTAIGARGDNLDNSFLGAIDELSVYNRALSAADIQAIYNAGGLGKCPPSPPTNCVPVPSGLASWWRAEGNALDQTGANNGTTSGNVTFVPGRVGQAFFFDGLGPVIHLGNPASLQVQDFTIEAWISRASTSAASRDGNGNGQIFGYDIGGYSLYLDPSGQPTLSHTGVDAVGAGVSITDTSFHHVAVAKSGSTVVFYVDGVARPAATYNTAFTFSNQAFIGGIGNSINFYGTVDELSFYNRALSVAEVQAIYNADGAGKCPTGTAPSILTQPESVTRSVGGTASFSVTALGTAPLSYQWRKNGTNILDATSTAYTILNVQTSDAGIYAVLVTNSFAPPVLSSNAFLTVTPTPPLCIAAPPN